MVQTQYFAVRKNGVIKGGTATYTVDTSTGTVSYSGLLNLKWPLPDKRVGPAQYQIDPLILQSHNLQKPGDTITVANVTFTVTTVDAENKSVDASFSVGGEPVSGFVNLNNSVEFFSVNYLTATAKVPILGTVLVQADPVSSLPTTLWQRIKKAFSK